MVNSGMKAVLRSRDGIGGEAVDNLDNELERAWKEWKKKKAKGRVRGEFPKAQELVKQRGAKGVTYDVQ